MNSYELLYEFMEGRIKNEVWILRILKNSQEQTMRS